MEIGPRMELRLIKVVEGLVGSKKGEGETVFHEFGELTPSVQRLVRSIADLGRTKVKDPGQRYEEEAR